MNGKAPEVIPSALLIGLVGVLGSTVPEATAEPTARSEANLFTAAPLYAGLFVEGTVWRFRGRVRETYYEPSDRRANRRGNVVSKTRLGFECSVTRVQRSADAVTSEITCDSEEAPLTATYGATSRGLFRFDGARPGDPAIATPTTAAGVEKARLVLPARPKPRKNKSTGEVGQVEIVTVARKGGAWCWDYYFFLGDESGVTLCFANGKPTRLASLSAGGFVRELKATLVK